MISYFTCTENAHALNLLRYDSQCFLISGHTRIKLTHFNCLVGWHFSPHGFRNSPCYMLHQLQLWIEWSFEGTAINISANEWSVPITSANAILWQSTQIVQTSHHCTQEHSGALWRGVAHHWELHHWLSLKANLSFQRHIFWQPVTGRAVDVQWTKNNVNTVHV